METNYVGSSKWQQQMLGKRYEYYDYKGQRHMKTITVKNPKKKKKKKQGLKTILADSHL